MQAGKIDKIVNDIIILLEDRKIEIKDMDRFRQELFTSIAVGIVNLMQGGI